MQYYYGEKNLLRALDEADFWMHQQVEHTQVIKAVTPNLESTYANMLDQFGNEFQSIHGEVVKYTESAIRSKAMPGNNIKLGMIETIKKCINLSAEFVGFLQDMLQNSQAVKSNQTSMTVIHHIIRESQYFIGIDQLILS